MKAFKDWFFSTIFPWVPKRLLSRITGVIMRIPQPWPLSAVLIRLFAWWFGVRLDWAEHLAGRYRSFDDFFTRKLKAGLRPIQGRFIHPVDGVLSQAGPVTDGQLLQAKGWTYSLGEFLGDEDLAGQYAGGSFATYYLCPRDYHRIHAPRAGELISARHIPGMLWPVNEWSVNNVRRLFNLNERVVLNFRSAEGRFSVVLVGATNVGHMTITLDPTIVTTQWRLGAPTTRDYPSPISVRAGDELGIFHLGSTVVCVFDKNLAGVNGLGPVCMGESAVLVQ